MRLSVGLGDSLPLVETLELLTLTLKLFGIALHCGSCFSLADCCGLLVKLTLSDLRKDARFFARPLESTQSNIERLVLFHSNVWHGLSLNFSRARFYPQSAQKSKQSTCSTLVSCQGRRPPFRVENSAVIGIRDSTQFRARKTAQLIVQTDNQPNAHCSMDHQESVCQLSGWQL